MAAFGGWHQESRANPESFERITHLAKVEYRVSRLLNAKLTLTEKTEGYRLNLETSAGRIGVYDFCEFSPEGKIPAYPI